MISDHYQRWALDFKKKILRMGKGQERADRFLLKMMNDTLKPS